MSENEKSLTAAEHVTAIKRAHNASTRGQHTAGVAVRTMELAGMLTFDRAAKDAPLPEGVLTRGALAKVLDCSSTTISKYRSIGRMDAFGIKPGHADYTFAVNKAATAWVTEALDESERTGSDAALVKAIADHRPGSNSEQGGKAGKNVKGSKKAQPASEKAKPVTVTRATVEADVVRVVAWITANDGKRLDAMSAESLDTIHALLMSAGESIEAAQVRQGTLHAVAV